MLDETPKQTKFAGLCIGGPLDGNIAINPMPELVSQDRRHQIVTHASMLDFNEKEALAETTYRYTPLWISGCLGFWIPVDELNKGIQSTNDFVLDHLAEAYANKHPSNGG